VSGGYDFGPDRGRNPLADLLERLAAVEAGLLELRTSQRLPVRILSGTGSPEGVVEAAEGSLYLSTGGGASTTLYVKEGGGSGSTGWAAK
jgi:hypothetical protein